MLTLLSLGLMEGIDCPHTLGTRTIHSLGHEMNPQWFGCRGGYYPIPLQPVLCSVPGDFPQEWNYLKTQVFPLLNDLCQAKKTCFKPVDVHWEKPGSLHPSDHSHDIDALSSQQLKISLDLISQSSYFFCILGQNYGPHRSEDSLPLPEPGPEREALSGIERIICVAAEGGHPWVLTGNNPTCSLTELQITKAALMGEPRHCFFYFKDFSLQEEEIDDDEMQRKLIKSLKNMIVEKLQSVKFFRSLQDLGELVMQDWSILIENINGPQLSPLSSLSIQDPGFRCDHENAIISLCHWFVPSQTTTMLKKMNSFTDSFTPTFSISGRVDSESERSILLLSGERGCGKSTLAAWWLQDFRMKNPDIPVIPYFCGISNSSVDIGSVLRQLTIELRRAHDDSQSEWLEGWHGLVKSRPLHTVVQAFLAAAGLRPCIVMLDGLDHLTGTSEFSTQEVKELLWLPAPLPPQCKLIITTTITDLTYKSLTLRPDVHLLPWVLLSDYSARRSILLQHLTLPSQEPTSDQIQYYLAGNLGHLPLYLAVVASELLTCGVARGEVEKEIIMEDYAAFDSTAELWMMVIRRWLKDYTSVRVGKSGTVKTNSPLYPVAQAELRGWVWDTLCLIHLSRAGLTEEQVWPLLELLGHRGARQVLPMEWARFRSATKRWVQESPDGALNFSHQSLGQAMDILLLKVKPSKRLKSLRRTRETYQLTIAQFLHKQTKELCRWTEGLELVPWHFEQSKSWKQLHAYLTDPEAVEHLSISWSKSSELRTDVVRYWSILITKGYDPFTSYETLFRNESCPPSTYETEHLSVPQPESNVIKGESSDQQEADSFGTFITEPHIQEQGNLLYPEVKGRAEVFAAELLLCLSREREAEQLLLQAQNTLSQAGEPGMEAAEDSVRLLLTVQQTLAELYVQTANYNEAQTYCKSALKTTQTLMTICPGGHDKLAVCKGQLLCTLCKILFAVDHLSEGYEVFCDIISMSHHRVHPCAEATTLLLQVMCRPDDIVQHLQTALRIRINWYGKEHPLVVDVEEHLADTLASSRPKQRQAVKLYRQIVEFRDQELKRSTPTSPFRHLMGCCLADSLVKLGRLLWQTSSNPGKKEALGLLQRALDLHIVLLGPQHSATAELQQILSTEFREWSLSFVEPKSRPGSYRRQVGSRSVVTISTALYSPPCSARGITNSVLNSLRKRPPSAWSNSTQTEPQREQGKTKNLSSDLGQLPQRPRSACQTTVFGPQSDILNLVPRPKTAPGPSTSTSSKPRAGALQRGGWCQLPCRYLLDDLAVKRLHQQIGSPLHIQKHIPVHRNMGQAGDHTYKNQMPNHCRWR